MLANGLPQPKFSQPTFECHVCGVSQRRTARNQKCCDGCKTERWLQYYRDYHKRRPKRGKRSIGYAAICRRCDGSFRIRTSRQILCEVCVNAQRTKVSLGGTFDCANCRVSVVKVYRRQSYCADCSRLRELNQLPLYKESKARNHSERYKTDLVFRQRRNAFVLGLQNAKYKTNPQYAINVRMRTAIGASLRGAKAGRKWEALVGYSLRDLMLHLERQFLPGMSWENRGEWAIDHILPLSGFNFTSPDDPEFLAAWNLTNLRPLWEAENQRKWAKRLLLL